MQQKITMQDIADKLNLSRNTVFKALNNKGNLSSKTKEKVINTAIEMGYREFAYKSFNTSSEPKEIALFTKVMPNSSHFAVKLLETFQENIRKDNITLSIYILTEYDLKNLILPANFRYKTTIGIICVELFDKNYTNLITKQDLPTLFIDSLVDNEDKILADRLYMENYNSIYNMVTHFINKGYKDILFVGDINHCQSFNQRYKGYLKAICENNLNHNLDLCITEKDKNFGINFILESIKNLKKLPNVFVCANDFIAIDVMNALKSLNYKIPKDTLVCGFDNSLESRIVEPSLTTVNIPANDMGIIASNIILNRIKNKNLPFTTTYVDTNIIYRKSTND